MSNKLGYPLQHPLGGVHPVPQQLAAGLGWSHSPPLLGMRASHCSPAHTPGALGTEIMMDLSHTYHTHIVSIILIIILWWTYHADHTSHTEKMATGLIIILWFGGRWHTYPMCSAQIHETWVSPLVAGEHPKAIPSWVLLFRYSASACGWIKVFTSMAQLAVPPHQHSRRSSPWLFQNSPQ